MKRRMFKKIRNIAVTGYLLRIRRSCGGNGGCVPLNPKESIKLRKLEQLYESHPKRREYELWCQRELNRILRLYNLSD